METKSCSSRMCEETTIMELPNVIMSDIVARLPIKDIFRSKCLSKRWYTISSDPSFPNLYHSRSHPFPCLLLSPRFPHDWYVSSVLELKSDYDYDGCPENRPVTLNPKFHLPPPTVGVYLKLKLIGSCNGFICLSYGSISHKDHSVYISNPLLGEYIKLTLPEPERNVHSVIYGFCCSDDSGQYKVLRTAFTSQGSFELKVYTVGGVDEKWRNLDTPPHHLACPNVNLNGALHWTGNGKTDSVIYSFDAVTEKIRHFSMPSTLGSRGNYLSLGELNNYLCMANHVNRQYMDIWLMKEYGNAESWTRDRILFDSTPPHTNYDFCKPKLIWKDGEILIHYNNGRQLVSYSPKEKKFREVQVRVSNGQKFFIVEKYIPSLFSLKTVMGDNFQVSKVYAKADIV